MDMYASDGWKELKERIDTAVEAEKERAFAGNSDNFYLCKGRIEGLQEILALEIITRHQDEEVDPGEIDDSV